MVGINVVVDFRCMRDCWFFAPEIGAIYMEKRGTRKKERRSEKGQIAFIAHSGVSQSGTSPKQSKDKENTVRKKYYNGRVFRIFIFRHECIY